MSIESAKAFMERMKNDEEFATKVTACHNAEARMAFVKAEGFDFTTEEIGGMKRELSEEELDDVVGTGCGYKDIYCWSITTPEGNETKNPS